MAKKISNSGHWFCKFGWTKWYSNQRQISSEDSLLICFDYYVWFAIAKSRHGEFHMLNPFWNIIGRTEMSIFGQTMHRVSHSKDTLTLTVLDLDPDRQHSSSIKEHWDWNRPEYKW